MGVAPYIHRWVGCRASTHSNKIKAKPRRLTLLAKLTVFLGSKARLSRNSTVLSGWEMIVCTAYMPQIRKNSLRATSRYSPRTSRLAMSPRPRNMVKYISRCKRKIYSTHSMVSSKPGRSTVGRVTFMLTTLTTESAFKTGKSWPNSSKISRFCFVYKIPIIFNSLST